MATFRLPTSQTLPNYRYEVDMDGVTFRMSFKYNSRDEAWYMTILSAGGVVLRAGIKVVSEWLLLRLWQDTNNRPAGEIITINLAEEIAKPGLEQLGVDTALLYQGES